MSQLLIVAVDNLSSTVARVNQIVGQTTFGFDVNACIAWPYKASEATFDSLFAQVMQKLNEADVVLLHRVLFSPKQQRLFFGAAKPTVFDYDDAIYAVPSSAYVQERQSVLGRGKQWVRWLGRGRPFYASRYKPLVQMLSQVTAVAAGNPHLAQFAAKHCAHVQVVPTVVDVTHFPVKQHQAKSPITIGWYGSPANHWYLDTIAPALKDVADKYGSAVRFQVISSEPYRYSDLSVEWIPWQRERELDDLLQFDIGLMPLTDDEWGRGKSGNKAIYYMGMGITAVVSPVGVNAHLITHGQTGFHAQTRQEWVAVLSNLVEAHEQRGQIGQEAREHVLQHYSQEVAAQKLTAVLHQALATVGSTLDAKR